MIVMRVVRQIGRALVDPAAALVQANRQPNLAGTALVLTGAIVSLGAAGLPRQLAILGRALAPSGVTEADLHLAAMRAGLTRMIVVDRILPSPTLLVAALVVAAVASVLMDLSRDRRLALGAVVCLGLTPVLVQQVGELAMTYIVDVGPRPTPGAAIDLPHRFGTGPLVFWRNPEPAPGWMALIDARLNLISVWCVVLWALGLRQLDGGRFRAWHLNLPLLALLSAGVVTWLAGPLVLSLLLGAG